MAITLRQTSNSLYLAVKFFLVHIRSINDLIIGKDYIAYSLPALNMTYFIVQHGADFRSKTMKNSFQKELPSV